MSTAPTQLPVIVAGGGIGGLAAALALVRQGFAVTVLEQAPEIGEIARASKLAPTAFMRLTLWASETKPVAVPCTPTSW